MPFPCLKELTRNGTANWLVGKPSSCCAACEILIAHAVAKIGEKYDLLDFVAKPGVAERRVG
jgi:hypothetical protein